MFASDLMKNEDFIYYIVFNLTCLVIVNYAFNALLKKIPDIAQQLAGPAFTPSVGKGLGGQSFSNFRANTNKALDIFGKNMPGKPGADGKNNAASMLRDAIGKMTNRR